MKKYTLILALFILVFTLLVGFKVTNASEFKIGSRGTAVKAFQQTLKNAGFLTGKVDGVYGKKTSAAATEYYKIYNNQVQIPANQTITSTPIIVSNQLYLSGCKSTSGYSSINGVACDGSVPKTTPPVSTCTPSGYDSKTGFRCGCSSALGFSSIDGSSCGNSSNFLPGCKSTSGYSSTNGVACDGSIPTPTFPTGCTSTLGYSSTTGLACNGSGTHNPAFPLGCVSSSGYSSINGAPCSGVTTPPPTFPPGCTSNSGFSSVDGSPCAAR